MRGDGSETWRIAPVSDPTRRRALGGAALADLEAELAQLALLERGSQPLTTRSYDSERARRSSSPVAVVSSPRSSGCGIVNGWWAGIGRPSPSIPSNSGKSTTHTNWRPPSETG